MAVIAADVVTLDGELVKPVIESPSPSPDPSSLSPWSKLSSFNPYDMAKIGVTRVFDYLQHDYVNKAAFIACVICAGYGTLSAHSLYISI